MSEVTLDISNLTVRQRLDLISQLWDSIDDNLTPEQITEMDEAMAEAEQHPELCFSLDQAMEKLRQSLR